MENNVRIGILTAEGGRVDLVSCHASVNKTCGCCVCNLGSSATAKDCSFEASNGWCVGVTNFSGCIMASVQDGHGITDSKAGSRAIATACVLQGMEIDMLISSEGTAELVDCHVRDSVAQSLNVSDTESTATARDCQFHGSRGGKHRCLEGRKGRAL